MGERLLLALGAAYLPGRENIPEDLLSRVFSNLHVWTLNVVDLQEIFARWRTPEVDLTGYGSQHSSSLDTLLDSGI